ncbi:hypothetical protein IRJ41_024337 [Triplophysa rosa]|uniref:Saposin B-type domain-containing protein n=1 Tax=Triplophysa rosa TaxID=992332 RepID=A0A9W7WMM0_TRIRA|nr:hypothetical protein IRJ41_024337 [Triplophysa rosa]
MLRNIFLVTCLICSARALPLEAYEDNSTENELDDNITEIMAKTGHKLPGACWACKWAMGKLRQQISVGTSQGAIKTMLREVCDGIGFLQFVCKNLVANYLGTLIEELSTTDDAPTICRHIGIC